MLGKRARIRGRIGRARAGSRARQRGAGPWRAGRVSAPWPAASLGLAAAVWLGCSAAAPPAHLVVIAIDTLRADALGAYGSELGATPSIDALAAESVVFEAAWAQGTYTPASYLSYMTSTPVRTHGWDFQLFDYPETGICGWTDLDTLAEVLSRNGFATNAWVANAALHPKRGFPRGFDAWNALEVASLEERGALLPFAHHRTDADVVAAAERALAGWSGAERQFLYVHLMTPHLPLIPSEEARRRFGIAPGSLPESGIDLATIQRWRESSEPAQRELTRRAYYASVWDADRLVARVLAAIDATDHRNDTVVVLLSDHGEELWERGDYGHRRGVWQHLAHVPFLIRVPGLPPDRVANRSVGLLDLAPTVLSVLGIPERPASWQGQDLFEGVSGGAVVSERFDEVAITRDGRWKAIATTAATGEPRWRYFDLATDAAEEHGLDDAPDAAELRSLHAAWVSRTPRAARDLDAPPVGICRAFSTEERRDFTERLRALGYVE